MMKSVQSVFSPRINQPLINAAVRAGETGKIAPLIPLLNQINEGNYDPRILEYFSIAGGFKGNLFHIIAFARDWNTELSKIDYSKLSFLCQKGLNINARLQNDAQGASRFQVPLTPPIATAVQKQGVSSFALFLIEKGANLTDDNLRLHLGVQFIQALPPQLPFLTAEEQDLILANSAAIILSRLYFAVHPPAQQQGETTTFLTPAEPFSNRESSDYNFYANALSCIDLLLSLDLNEAQQISLIQKQFGIFYQCHQSIGETDARPRLLDNAAKRYFACKDPQELRLAILPPEVREKIKEIEARASRPLRDVCVGKIVSLSSTPDFYKLPQHVRTELAEIAKGKTPSPS